VESRTDYTAHANLTALWNWTGSDCNDNSGNYHHMDANGTPSFVTGQGWTGTPDGLLVMDDANGQGCIDAADDDGLELTTFTYVSFVKSDGAVADEMIYDDFDDPNGFRLESDSLSYTMFIGDANTDQSDSTDGIDQTNIWRCVVATYSADANYPDYSVGQLEIYNNGVVDVASPAVKEGVYYDDTPASIGINHVGYLGPQAMFATVLTPTQICEICTYGLEGHYGHSGASCP
jgi:hypothetical protein